MTSGNAKDRAHGPLHGVVALVRALVARAEAAGPPIWASLTATAGAVAAAWTLRRGIVVTPDGWKYWESSISLLLGQGFTYSDGVPVDVFPPLYPAFLAIVQAATSVSGSGLVVATVILAGVTAGLWYRLFAELCVPHGDGVWLRAAVATFLVLFIAYSYRAALSETLLLPLLGGALVALARLGREDAVGRTRIGWTAIAIVCACALTATRNAGIAFVPGLALAMALQPGRRRLGERVAAAGATLALPVGTWLFLRVHLGQGGSHALRRPEMASVERILGELVRGVPELFAEGWVEVGSVVALAVLGAWTVIVTTHVRPDAGAARRSGVAVLCASASALLVLFVMMAVVHVSDALSGRFLWFLPMSAVVCLGAGASWLEPGHRRLLLTALVTLVALLQGTRVHSLPYRYAMLVEPMQTLAVPEQDDRLDPDSRFERLTPPPF